MTKESDTRTSDTLTFRSGGGGGVPIGFQAPDLRKGFKEGKWATNAPPWRGISHGLNLSYRCRACNEYVMIKMGWVYQRNLPRIARGKRCLNPACRQRLLMKDLKELLLYKCVFSWDGILNNEEEESVTGKKVFSSENYFRTFGDPVAYQFLDLTTERL